MTSAGPDDEPERDAQRDAEAAARDAEELDAEGLPVPPGVGAQLAQVLDEAARELLSRGRDNSEGIEHTLRLIVAGAVHSIPHVTRAGVSLLEPGGSITARAPSDQVVVELDQLQNTLGEGPCRDSIAIQDRVLIPDMATAVARWPRFAPAALERGVGATVSFQLFAQHGSAGALNLYADQAGVLDDSSLDIGALFASHAAIALHGARRVTQLNAALRSRDVIGQAKGILIERFTLTEDQAFAMLVRSSQEINLKLYAVAEWLVGEAIQGRGGPPTPS